MCYLWLQNQCAEMAERNRDMKTELSEYKAIGTNVRLIKGMLTSLVNLSSGVIPKNLYMPKVRIIEREISKMASEIEDRMLHDYPEVSNEYLDVFYGSVVKDENSELGSELNGYASEITGDMLKHV